MRCQGLFIGFRQLFIPGAVLRFHGLQGVGQLRDGGLSRHSGHQELASSGLRHGATAVGQLPGLRLGRRKAGLQLPDADPAVCQVLVLGLPCGQQRLGGLKGLGKPLLSLRFRRGQGVKRGLGRLHVWLSADDVLILPELSPGRLRVQLRLADCFPEAGQLFQQLLVPVRLGGEVLEFGPCRLDPLSGVLGVSEAVCKVAGVLVLALQLLQLQGLSVALPVIFLGLGVLGPRPAVSLRQAGPRHSPAPGCPPRRMLRHGQLRPSLRTAPCPHPATHPFR